LANFRCSIIVGLEQFKAGLETYCRGLIQLDGEVEVEFDLRNLKSLEKVNFKED